MGTDVSTLISLLQEFDPGAEVAIAVDGQRRELRAVGLDHELRQPGEPVLDGPPVLWLIPWPDGTPHPPRKALG